MPGPLPRRAEISDATGLYLIHFSCYNNIRRAMCFLYRRAFSARGIYNEVKNLSESGIRLKRTGTVTVMRSTLDAITAARDPDAALLYLYILSSESALDTSHAAHMLGFSAARMHSALERLTALGIFEILPAAPAHDTQPDPAVLCGERKENTSFAAVCDFAELTTGRALSERMLSTLYHIYNELGLPAEVMMLLIQSLSDAGKRRITYRDLEKEAYIWVDRNLFTLDDAERYLHLSARRNAEMAELRRRLGIDGHAPTPTEEKYLRQWLDWSMPEELILLAYDKTVSKFNSVRWSYFHSIIERWHAQGLRTLDDVKARDQRPNGAGAPSSDARIPDDVQEYASRIRSYLDRKRSGS